MSKGKSPWDEGRRAWERLNGWHQDAPSASPGHPDNGDGAVTALADIGLVRHLLDQAELVAVRTARRHGKSWAEIATRLGVTRQSAWERWRDLDEGQPSTEPRSPSSPPRAAARPQLDSEAIAAGAADEIVRDRRRRSTIVVPDVIGRQWDQARRALLELGLVAVGSDPDGPPLGALGWPDGVVTDQSPEAGARVPRSSAVKLWIERGGGSGVREPRRPRPTPRVGREMQYEPSDEAVG